VVKRKAEFLAGRYCCRQALANYQVANFDVAVGANRAPVWPVGIKGAISHNSHHAMVALTKNPDALGIGIDIESIMSAKTMNDIKDAILRGSEFEHLTVNDISPAGALSLMFSFKESFFKAAYTSTGFYFDFDAVTIDKIDYQNQRFELTVNQDLNPKIRPGMKFDGIFTCVDEQVISLIVL
jgi:4'-phosphopantetheinyl transferase EntD